MASQFALNKELVFHWKKAKQPALIQDKGI